VLSDFIDIPQKKSDAPEHSGSGTSIEIILADENDI
jgi:hypothetical protein